MGYYEPYPYAQQQQQQQQYEYGRTGTRREPSMFDGLTLSPLPYPIILILIVISLFLATKFYFSYEEAVEDAEVQFNWLLLLTPLVLIFVVKWLSSIQDPASLFGFLSYGRRAWPNSGGMGPPEAGASPWGVAGLIVLVLVLVQLQSVFLDS